MDHPDLQQTGLVVYAEIYQRFRQRFEVSGFCASKSWPLAVIKIWDGVALILLMKKILHHLGCIKPCK